MCRCACALAVFLSLPLSGCGVKTEVKVPVAPRIEAAKSASMQELLAMLRGARDRITALSSRTVKLSLTVAKPESGKALVYHSAPGYILLKRPDNMLLNVQVPVTKTTAVALLSRGDNFELFSPRDNKLYVGRNSAGEFELDENGQSLAFSARPLAIIEALLPQGLELGEEMRIARTEEQDAAAKYYVLTVYREGGGQEVKVLRRLWIERSEMALARVDTFAADGRIAGTVRYSDFGVFDGQSLPRAVSIERPVDGYSLSMQFGDWRVNPQLDDSVFVLTPPPEVKRVVLREKRTG